MQCKWLIRLVFGTLLTVIVWVGQLEAQTFFGNNVGTPIPLTGTGGSPCDGGPTTSTAFVPISGTIGVDATLEEVSIDITHTFDADLDITLISPLGTPLELTSDNGGDGDNYDGTVFADGFPDITTGMAPFSGTFEAEGGSFSSTFAGESITGSWTLEICDDAGGDAGTFNAYSITFSGGGPAPPLIGCGSFPGNNQGTPIPPTGTGGSPCEDGPQTSVANVPFSGLVGTDVYIESVEVDITHTFDADLDIELISPSGTHWELSSDNGGDGDNYSGTVFMDGAPSITTGMAPFSGIFEPEAGPFAIGFAGENVTGSWVLSICDDAGGDSGTFMDFELNICEIGIDPPICNDLTGNNLPSPIPPTGTGGSPCDGGPQTSIVPVAAVGVIGTDFSIESVEVDITHTFDADLDIELISPAGTHWELSSDNGGDGDNYSGTVFRDGFPSIITGTPPFTGLFEPEAGPFAIGFAGESVTGNWTLSVCDDAGGDAGTLVDFQLTLCQNEEAPPPPDCDEFTGDNLLSLIPPTGTGGFPCDGGPQTSSLTIADVGNIGTDFYIESVEVDISHTFDADLDIELISPAGTPWELSSDNGEDGNNYSGTIFFDGAPSITTGNPPFFGLFEPEAGPFALGFAGESVTGTWTLSVCDDAGGDSGILNDFKLSLCEISCSVPDFMLAEIGCGGGPSDYCYNAATDTWTVSSETCYNPAFYRSSDDEAFVSTELCGDGEIIAEVTGITDTGFGGIAMREDLSEDSKMLQLMIDGVFLTRRELRQSSPGTAFAHLFQTLGKNWLRLTRSGNVFGAYHSSDGINWQPVLVTQIAMSNCIEVGLMTQNGAPSGGVEATFENVSIIGGAPLAAPEGVDIAQEVLTEVEVFPNPASTEVNITLNSFYGEAVEIQVYNDLGQLMTRKVIDEVTFSIGMVDVSRYASGTYLFRIVAESHQATRRVVVNR